MLSRPREQKQVVMQDICDTSVAWRQDLLYKSDTVALIPPP